MANSKIHINNLHRKKDKEDDNLVLKLFKCNFCMKIINPYKNCYIQLIFDNKTKEYFHLDCYINSQCNGMIYYNTEHKLIEPDILNVNGVEDIDNNTLFLDLS